MAADLTEEPVDACILHVVQAISLSRQQFGEFIAVPGMHD